MDIKSFGLNDDVITKYYRSLGCIEEIKVLESNKDGLCKYLDILSKDDNKDLEEVKLIQDGIKTYQMQIDHLKNQYPFDDVFLYFKFPLCNIEELILKFANIYFDLSSKIDYCDGVTSLVLEDGSYFVISHYRDFNISYLKERFEYSDDKFIILEDFIKGMIKYRADNNIIVVPYNFYNDYLRKHVMGSLNFYHYLKNHPNSVVDNFICDRLKGKKKILSYPILR